MQKLRLLVFALTLLANVPAIEAQACQECAENCPMLIDADQFLDYFCSCPTYSECTPVDICLACYSSDYEFCYDSYNECYSMYFGTFSTSCGCAGGIA